MYLTFLYVFYFSPGSYRLQIVKYVIYWQPGIFNCFRLFQVDSYPYINLIIIIILKVTNS